MFPLLVPVNILLKLVPSLDTDITKLFWRWLPALTNVKNVEGLCVLIKLVKSESTEGRVANEEQIRNILNSAFQEKNNLLIINGIIDNLLNLGLIEPSDD